MAWTQSRSKTSDARGTDGVCLVCAAPTRLLLQCVDSENGTFRTSQDVRLKMAKLGKADLDQVAVTNRNFMSARPGHLPVTSRCQVTTWVLVSAHRRTRLSNRFSNVGRIANRSKVSRVQFLLMFQVRAATPPAVGDPPLTPRPCWPGHPMRAHTSQYPGIT